MIELQPGIYHGIPAAVYHALPYVTNTYLKKINKCPANGKVEDPDDTKALRFGRAAHVMTLEGDDAFHSECVVLPENAPKRPTERQVFAKKPSPETLYAIDWWKSFSANANGKTILSLDDYNTLRGVKDSVRSHPFAKLLLAEGVSETTVIFDVKVNGQVMRCKCRPDRTPSLEMMTLIDLKTAEDVGLEAFRRSCIKYSYFQQSAFYIDGYNSVRHLPMKKNAAGEWEHDKADPVAPEMDAFAFIAVEKKPPYRCEVYTLGGDSTYLLRGRESYERALKTEAECRQRGSWPNYVNAGCQELVPWEEEAAA